AIEACRVAGEVVRDSPALIEKQAVVARSPDRATGAVDVVARSPDRATGPDRRSPLGKTGDLRSAEVARSGDRATTEDRATTDGDPTTTILPSDETWLFLKALFLAEVGVARLIHALRQGPHPMSGANVVSLLQWVEQRMNLTLAETQRTAIEAAATQKVLVIT